MCGVSRNVVKVAALPVVKLSSESDDTFCSVGVETTYDRTSVIAALPATGDTLPGALSGTNVVISAATDEILCGVSRNVVKYASLPLVRSYTESDETFGIVDIEETIDLESAFGSLPSAGDSYIDASTTTFYVVDAKDTLLMCGVVRRVIKGVDTTLFPICDNLVRRDHPDLCVVNVEVCIDLAPSQPPPAVTLGCLDIDYREEEILPGLIRTTREYIDSLPADKVVYMQDPETGSTIEVTISFSCTATSVNLGQAYYDVDIQNVTCRLFKITTKRIDGLPAADTEYQTVPFRYPAVHNFTTVADYRDAEGVGHFSVSHDITPADTQQVIARVDITYHTTPQQPTAVDRPELVSVRYEGVLFNVILDEVITAGDTLTANTASDDRKWGLVSESYTYPASGTQIWPPAGGAVVDGDCTRWKYNLYRKRIVTVLGGASNPVAGPP
jgi:hypothetical protein